MTNKFSLFLFAALLCTTWSCSEDDENMDPVGEWTLSQPTLTSPGNNSSIVLDGDAPQEDFDFEWSAATSSEGYNVTYNFVITTDDDDDFSDPIYQSAAEGTMASISAQDFDAALEDAGFEVGATADLLWTATALSQDKENMAAPFSISVTRFAEVAESTTLYIIGDGEVAGQLELEGTTYTSPTYISLQEGVNYDLNTQEDGSGDSYGVVEPIGTTDTPDGDNVSGSTELVAGGSFTAARSQMYMLTFDLESMTATWQYYNIKLFHWDEDNGGWDARNEFLMTYVHPYSFTTTQELSAGYHMKFNSPWDVQFGADDATALSGTMTNNGGANFNNITQSGTYEVNIQVESDYSTGTYEFILQ